MEVGCEIENNEKKAKCRVELGTTEFGFEFPSDDLCEFSLNIYFIFNVCFWTGPRL